MGGQLNKAREKLAIKILEDFKGKITGDYSPICVGENPENKYFVGKLLPVSEEQTSSFGSDVFIESIGIDFYVSAEDISTAAIKVYPRGDFYYHAYPTFEQQRAAFLDEINDSEETPFEDFNALIEAYKAAPDSFSKRKSKLVPIYKKVNIHSENSFAYFKLNDLIDPSTGYGFANEKHTENQTLGQFIDDLQDHITQDPDCYTHEIFEKNQDNGFII